MATKLALAFIFCVLVSGAVGTHTNQDTRLTEAQQCRLERLSASQPSQRINSEGGVTELWNEDEDQFRCAGVAAMRNTLSPNSLSLPNFHPFPRMVYVQQGQGLLSITFPGCPETFQSEQFSERREREEEQERGSSGRDLHQKVHRIRQGDIVAIPAGAAHWCFNDGNEELVAVSFNDLNNQANQLDQRFRSFYLAGGVPRREQGSLQGQQERKFQNILRGFDEELLAEAFNLPTDVVRKMQKEDERGLIVKARNGMRVIRPGEKEVEDEDEELTTAKSNGMEETLCTMRIRQNIDDRSAADVYSRQAGRINLVNQHKLPILRYLDMSAEKGNLLPNALHSPHWSMNGHSIVYVTRGDAQVEVAGSNGQTVMNQRVRQGEMFVVPQFFASTAKAGSNGFEYVAVKTTGTPMKSPLAGYTSVFRAMPLQVIANAYQISPSQAQQLKFNRGSESTLFSPRSTSS